MPRLPRRPNFWLFAMFVWFGVLWGLSSFALPGVPSPPVDHFDKLVHFGYFFGGAILLSAHLFFKNPGSPSWRVIIPAVIVFIALVGALDEFHQSFIPGRSGNDLPDWLADVMGGTIGALTFKAIHRRLQ
jgi:VanZ family protein